MISYRGLYEKMRSPENIKLAISNMDSETHRKEIKALKKLLRNHEQRAIRKVLAMMDDYEEHPHNVLEIHDGMSNKKRTIVTPTFEDLVVQHCLITVLKDVLLKPLYSKVFGSIPGKGVHAGKIVVEKWIRKDTSHCRWFGQMDIKNFFASIDLDILEKKLRKHIRDVVFVKYVMRCITSSSVDGLPLGFYTSPWLAHFYLSDFDHWVKEKLGVVHYIRYADDMLIFGSTEREVQYSVEMMQRYAREELGLTIKDSYKVMRFSYKDEPHNKEERMDIRKRKDLGHAIDFMGFKFYRSRTIIREKLMLKICRRVRRVGSKDYITKHDAQSILSYMGWFKYTDSFNLFRSRIAPYLSTAELKAVCSRHDKKKNFQMDEVIFNESQLLSLPSELFAA